MRFCIFSLLFILMLSLGCSSGNIPLTPEQGIETRETLGISHTINGLWQFLCDPANGTLEYVQLRDADLHLNALRFLEPPVNYYLSVENISFNGNQVEADLGLRHPFSTQTQYCGFDVCGVLITSGSLTGFSDPALRMATDGDVRLLNADGYTRWWNPAEFPVNLGTMFSYNDGALGTPESEANFNATINPYKYFCDDLGANDPISEVTVDGRGLFLSGKKNVRHYIIEFPASGGFVFNYAIDASWKSPGGSPPYNAPDDFPPAANKPEAYRLSVTELNNTLWNNGVSSGGALSLSIDVYDHYNSELNQVLVESPGSFSPISSNFPSGGGTGYSTYDWGAVAVNPIHAGSIQLLITVRSEVTGYQGLLPNVPVEAYFTYDVQVDDHAPQQTGHVVVGLPDWCALTEGCTSGVDNLQLITNLVKWDLDGPYNDGNIVKWWEGHLTYNPPYSTSIIQSHVTSLGYQFQRTNEVVLDPTGCRMIIVVFIGTSTSNYMPFSASDVQILKDYVAGGGVLCFLIEHLNYFNPVTFDPLMDMLGVPLSYGGNVEPPSTYTQTSDITPHYLTTDVSVFQYWTAGEFNLESPDCVSLIRSPSGENMVVTAPIDVN